MTMRLSDKHFAFLDNMLRSLARFGISVLVARLAELDRYATFVLAASAEIATQSVITSVAIAPMISLASGRSGRDEKAVYDRGRLLTRRIVILTATIGLLAAAFAGRFGISASMVLGFSASTVAWSLVLWTRGRLSAGFRSRQGFIGDLAGLAVAMALTVAAASSGLDVVAAFWWSNAAGGFVAWALMMKGCSTGRPTALDSASHRRFGDMSRAMTVGTVAVAAAGRIQPFVLASVGGAALVGLFGVVATLIGPMRLLSMSLSNLLRPRFSLYSNTDRPERLRSTMAAAVVLVLLAGGCGTLFSAVLGGTFVRMLFGTSFTVPAGVIPLAAIYATLEAVGAIGVVCVQVVLANGAAVATRRRVVVTATTLALLWPACARFGVAGAFGTVAVLEVVFVIALFTELHRAEPSFGLRRPDWLPFVRA